MKILTEEEMEKKVAEEGYDFLRTLRMLNSSNINNYPELRSAFFSSLVVAKEYKDLEDSIRGMVGSEKLEKEMPKVMANGLTLSSKYGMDFELSHLRGEIPKIKFNGKYIIVVCRGSDFRTGYGFSTYISLIAKIENIIKDYPGEFKKFKIVLTEALISRVCEPKSFIGLSEDDIEILNKLITILIETTYDLEAQEEFPMIITEDLINELNGWIKTDTGYKKPDYKKILRTTNILREPNYIEIVRGFIAEKHGPARPVEFARPK